MMPLGSPGVTNLLLMNPDQQINPNELLDNGSVDFSLTPDVLLCSAVSVGGRPIVQPGGASPARGGKTFWDDMNDIGTFIVGVGDGVSGGLTNDIREHFGTNDVVDQNSAAYTGGIVTGVGLGFALGFAGGAAKGACVTANVLRGYNTAMGAYATGKAAYNLASGKGTAMDAVTLGLPLVGGALGTVASKLSSALRITGCFAAGTPILTPEGSKPIEEIRPGDWVITAPDDDPDADPVPRPVEETFENYLPILDLYVNGRTIRTTAEHPFWVKDSGWVAAQQLEAGDELLALDGRWLKVDGLEGPKASETVYYMSVAE